MFGSLVYLQKVIFMDTTEGVSSVIRPYWSEATGDRANVVQAQSDMLEIVPPGTSKGNGVKMLLDHLGVSPDEVKSGAFLQHLKGTQVGLGIKTEANQNSSNQN